MTKSSLKMMEMSTLNKTFNIEHAKNGKIERKNLEKVKLASKQTVSIPLHHNLTDEHIEYIITEVKDLYNWMNM